MSSSLNGEELPLETESCCCGNWMTITTTILVLIILFKLKSPIQYYFKLAVFTTIIMLVALVVMPFLWLRPTDPRNVNITSKIMTLLLRIYKIDVEIENEKYFNLKQPYIIINNHQSLVDFLTLMKIWPGGKCTPLAKKEIFWTWPFGLSVWLCGITFIDRLNAERARGTIEMLANRINKENLRVWIYPEGTRSSRTELLPFKKGAFHLAVQAQVPIVCVVTSSYSNFYNAKEKKFLNEGKIKVRVLPPFQTSGMSEADVAQLTKHMQEAMQKEFDSLNKEIGLEEKYYTKASNESSIKSPSIASIPSDASMISTFSDDYNQIVGEYEDEDNQSLSSDSQSGSLYSDKEDYECKKEV